MARYRLEAYATLRRGLITAGPRKHLQEDFPYLARQSEEQSSIGFQPVASVDDGWFAFLSRTMTSGFAEPKSKVGWWFATGWKPMLHYAVASSRRVRGSTCSRINSVNIAPREGISTSFSQFCLSIVCGMIWRDQEP
jgi:hypothetical protein